MSIASERALLAVYDAGGAERLLYRLFPGEKELLLDISKRLSMLLDIAEHAKDAIDPGDYPPSHVLLGGTCDECFESWPCATERTRLAIEAFEALP